MRTEFYGGPLDGQTKRWPEEVPDEWEVALARHPKKRKIRYQRFTRKDHPDVFVCEGYDQNFHAKLFGELE